VSELGHPELLPLGFDRMICALAWTRRAFVKRTCFKKLLQEVVVLETLFLEQLFELSYIAGVIVAAESEAELHSVSVQARDTIRLTQDEVSLQNHIP
jgi:hypothetical protein